MKNRVHSVAALSATAAIVVIAAILAGPILSAGSGVSIWLTTPTQSSLLSPQAGIPFAPDSGSNPLTIDVDAATVYQQMDGFGASFTDSSAWLIFNALSTTARAQLMTQLFDRQNGIGLSHLRQPMGAADFALSSYTYDDIPAGQTDPTLANFSVAHDDAYIVPLLQQALQINPAVTVMATPWSAPAWMKTSGSLNGGGLKADAVTMNAFAAYFVKFVQQYGARGISVARITPQNEPLNASASYPTMTMDASQQATFIGSYLAPALAGANLRTDIVAYDHNWDNTSYATSVLGGPAGGVVTGSAWHCYAGAPAAMSTVHAQFPFKDIFFTECTAGEWSTAFAANLKWDMENLIIGAPLNWARTISKWNIALDQNDGPQNGGCQNCRGLVTIDRSVSPARVTFNYDYYALGHISRFVLPGARRIAATTFGAGSIEDVAFQNPDGSLVLVAFNGDTLNRTIKIRQSGQSASFTLAAGAAATFVWNPPAPNAPPTVAIVSPASGSTFTQGATVTFTAAASDNDGAVTQVAYYSGSTSIGTSTAAPYTVRWKPGRGSYAVTAVATDNGGAQTRSTPITISVVHK